MVKCIGRGLVVKRPGVLSRVQMLNLVLGVGVFCPFFQNKTSTPQPQRITRFCRAHTNGGVRQRTLKRVLRRVLETAFEKVLGRRVLRRCLAVGFNRKKGSEKGSEKGS